MDMNNQSENFDGAPLLDWYPKWLRPIILALFPVLGIAGLALTAWCVFLTVQEGTPPVLSALTVIVAAGGTVFLFWYGWVTWIDYCRVVRFAPDGLIEIDPDGRTRHFPWSDFREICICDAAEYPERPYGNTTYVIAFILPGVKKNADQRWPAYATRHYRKIICTLYTEETVRKLRQVCPREIPDFRVVPPYHCE